MEEVIKSPFRNCMAHLKKEPSEAEFRGRMYQYTNYFYVCDESGIEFTNKVLGDINTRQIYDQYRQEHNIPSTSELKEYRHRNHYTLDDMDDLLGVENGTFYRYELGEVPTLELGLKLRSLMNV